MQQTTKETTYTELDFIHGWPESILLAKKQPKILVVWPHGDETLGPRLAYRIFSEHPQLLDHVDYMCGNPKAAHQDPAVRCVETDLNRSYDFAGEPDSYEETRAKIILDQVATGNYDYVLDVHTSTTDVGKFFLAYKRNSKIDEIIAASSITRTVLMPDQVATAGLIGKVPHAIAIEYNRALALETGVEDILQILYGLIDSNPFVEPMEREFFHVTRTILKTADPGLHSKNFELCNDGYYPVLFGENSYRTDPTKDYLGFAATAKDNVVL